MFNLVFDRCVLGRPYPNLAPVMDASNGYHGMGDTYPFIVPLRLLYYTQDHNYPVNVVYVGEGHLPENSYYPVGLGWFDFDQDYFNLLPSTVFDAVASGALKILFYYHEGDNPFRIKQRLDSLINKHKLDCNCYKFISSNTQADAIDRFVYFPDHELFYWRNAVVWNNRTQPGVDAHVNPRSREFTLLSRIHKWWRATIVSCLHRQNLLNNSYWSYGDVDIGDQYTDNPIELVSTVGLEKYMQKFLADGPYCCDSLSADQHNAHYMFVPEHFADSYCNLVLETFFDADQSNGCFLSEKTFKPIRHAQPFVIFGTANSLATLKTLGYRTFDQYIDNTYDSEINNTQRFKKLISTVKKLSAQNLHELYQKCFEDIVYNQNLFLSSKYDRLNTLHLKLLNK